MSKNVIFYFTKGSDDYSLIQLKYLQKSNQDIFVFVEKTNRFNKSKFKNVKDIFEYETTEGKYTVLESLNGCGLNKYRLVKREWEKHSDLFNEYEYIYLIDQTFKYSLELSDLFNDLSNDDSDLLSTYIQKLKGTNIAWGWYSEFKKLYNDDDYPQVLKAYEGGFTRLSVKAINFLMEKNDPVMDYFIDLSLPTMLYNNGFKITSLSETENDDEFNKYKYCNSKTYYYNTNHIPVKNFDKTKGVIYNTYKKPEELFDLIEHKIENPDITIVMPVYNEQDTVRRAIESILTQDNPPTFELWCLNDGSTDNTLDILEEYENHPNVIVINRDHEGLVSTLNFGFENANGKYILRMDADDVSLPNRLRHQFDYMESHPECDILGSSPIYDWNDQYIQMGDYEITLESLEGSNRIFHPATIMRNSSMKKLPFLYEYYYDYAEDYKLWVTAILHGLRVFSDSTAVIRYSAPKTVSEQQKTTAKRIQNILKQLNKGITIDKERQMTAIVSFRNEYDEIEKTVASIRATTTNMPIVLVNDASDNDYDYEFVAKKFGCKYLHNNIASGVAGARMDAVKMVDTKYFIILDGHMRMYEQHWDLRAIKIIEEYGENNVYFGETSIISKESTNHSKNENAKNVSTTYGACLMGEQFTLTPKWISAPSEKNFKPEDNIIPTPLLLGADYMMSVEFWNKIHGLEGLLSWGQDETLLSLKTWLAGSKVYLIKDMIFGHVYRTKRPYNAIAIEMNSNYIYCNYLFARDYKEYRQLNYMYEKHLGHNWFMKAYDNFMERFEQAKSFKEYFFNEVVPKGCTQTMDWFWDFNYDADPNQVQGYYDKRDAILKDMPEDYGLNFVF